MSDTNSDVDVEIHATIKVDSIKIYPAKENGYLAQFMFSPLGQKNKIWISNPGFPLELDLKTGVWSGLSKKFGDAGKILKPTKLLQ